MPVDDETAALVVRAQKGDAEAFQSLVHLFLRPAYSVALAVVGRPADAEDVAQDAMLQAFERLDSCRQPDRFGGWLLQIVRNRGRNWLDQRRLRDVPAQAECAEYAEDAPLPDAGAFRGRLLQAIGSLSETQREVVLLHDLEGWTHAEIAAVLGISELMSRQHLFQARRLLRVELDEPSLSEGAP